jgi:hypothetical protein
MANLPPVSTTPASNFAISFTSVVDTGGKFATGVNDTGGKFATGINNTSETGGKISRRCQRHRWQTMGLISGCSYLKVNLKAKMYIYVLTLLSKGVPTKLLKFF